MKETIISLVRAKERMIKKTDNLLRISWVVWIVFNLTIIIISMGKVVTKSTIITYLILSILLGALNVGLTFLKEKNMRIYDKYIIVGIMNYIGQILRQEHLSTEVIDTVQNLNNASCIELGITLSANNKEDYFKSTTMLTKKFKDEFSNEAIKVWLG